MESKHKVEEDNNLIMLSRLYKLVKEYFSLHTLEPLQHELFLVNRKLPSYKE
jgi:hypothetical protein